MGFRTTIDTTYALRSKLAFHQRDNKFKQLLIKDNSKLVTKRGTNP